jgi:transcriptional regulator with GAF, ATPase, and Fis domain
MIERAAILSKGDRLRLDLALVTTANSQDGIAVRRREWRAAAYHEVERMQRDNVIAALHYTRGKIYGPKGAAEILGVNPSTLAARMRSFGIKRDRNRF